MGESDSPDCLDLLDNEDLLELEDEELGLLSPDSSLEDDDELEELEEVTEKHLPENTELVNFSFYCYFNFIFFF